jgi:hypothetical protein
MKVSSDDLRQQTYNNAREALQRYFANLTNKEVQTAYQPLLERGVGDLLFMLRVKNRRQLTHEDIVKLVNEAKALLQRRIQLSLPSPGFVPPDISCIWWSGPQSQYGELDKWA